LLSSLEVILGLIEIENYSVVVSRLIRYFSLLTLDLNFFK